MLLNATSFSSIKCVLLTYSKTITDINNTTLTIYITSKHTWYSEEDYNVNHHPVICTDHTSNGAQPFTKPNPNHFSPAILIFIQINVITYIFPNDTK